MQKFLIVGLGNIGEKYANTRHNIGFLVVDEFVKQQNQAFAPNNFGDVAQFKYKAKPITVLKPDTYMNLSGNAVKYWLNKENIPIQNLLVITDDLNLDFGMIRLRSKGSDGGHNGLKSIQHQLNTTQYPRYRFGVGSQFGNGQQVDYVLGEWNAEERNQLQERLEVSAKLIESFIFSGLNNTMNNFNGK